MIRHNFFSSGPWDGSRPTARLSGAPRTKLGRVQPNGCVVPGSGERPVFQYNNTTKVCGVFSMDTSTEPYPDCVQAPPDYLGGGYNGWIPPGCAPAQAPAPVPAPAPAPAPEPAPPSVQPPGPVSEPPNYYPVSGQCPAGQVWNGTICEAAPVTKVSPGASVPIVPRPFPTVPMQTPVPISARAAPSMAPPPVPQKEFAPSMRPSCPLTPYKTPMFSSKTVPTRPDAFTNKQQWTS
jgi:hypothetical protein